ncbi:hypothetical protein, partial [Escherichia coli]|uniref:hypothetical protein n=1 Tax=Escherichia coli TaxID=562 RepID=UPI001BC8A1EA
TQKITDLWIQFSSTAGPDGKQVISVREESLSGCYRRNSHGTPILFVVEQNKRNMQQLIKQKR